MHIALVIHSLERGGAERVMSVMANYWVTQGRKVTIVTLAPGRLDAYALAGSVRRVSLDLAGASGSKLQGLWNNMRRWHSLRIALKKMKPDVVISFTTNINNLTLLALAGTRIPVIVSERIDPSRINVGYFKRVMSNFLYPHAAALAVQTEHARDFVQKLFPSLKIRVIPNPIPQDDPDFQQELVPLRELLGIGPDTGLIAGMGRLGPEKGFDLLIELFIRLSAQYKNWHLVIFGEGHARSALEKQMNDAGIESRVHLPGLAMAARQRLSEADMFVLSSRYEGFPNVLLEAMACGLPVVSFDCPSGPGDIIHHAYDGLLVKAGDTKALEAAMTTLMEGPEYRRKLGMNAVSVLERFSMARIMGSWNELIDESGLTR